MKRLLTLAILAAALGLAPSPAQAMPGFLLRWRTDTSITGKFIYVCTYRIYMGSEQEVVLSHMCPQTMDFD